MRHFEDKYGFYDIFADEGMLFDKEDAAASVEAVPGVTFRGFKNNDTEISFMGKIDEVTLAGLKLDLYRCQLPEGTYA